MAGYMTKNNREEMIGICPKVNGLNFIGLITETWKKKAFFNINSQEPASFDY